MEFTHQFLIDFVPRVGEKEGSENEESSHNIFQWLCYSDLKIKIDQYTHLRPNMLCDMFEFEFYSQEAASQDLLNHYETNR